MTSPIPPVRPRRARSCPRPLLTDTMAHLGRRARATSAARHARPRRRSAVLRRRPIGCSTPAPTGAMTPHRSCWASPTRSPAWSPARITGCFLPGRAGDPAASSRADARRATSSSGSLRVRRPEESVARSSTRRRRFASSSLPPRVTEVPIAACLDALIHVGGGPTSSFERIATQADGSSLFTDDLLRSLEVVGQIDVRRDERCQPVEWEVPPAQLAGMSDGRFVLRGVWSGASVADFAEAVSEAGGLLGQLADSERAAVLGPQRPRRGRSRRAGGRVGRHGRPASRRGDARCPAPAQHCRGRSWPPSRSPPSPRPRSSTSTRPGGSPLPASPDQAPTDSPSRSAPSACGSTRTALGTAPGESGPCNWSSTSPPRRRASRYRLPARRPARWSCRSVPTCRGSTVGCRRCARACRPFRRRDRALSPIPHVPAPVAEGLADSSHHLGTAACPPTRFSLRDDLREAYLRYFDTAFWLRDDDLLEERRGAARDARRPAQRVPPRAGAALRRLGRTAVEVADEAKVSAQAAEIVGRALFGAFTPAGAPVRAAPASGGRRAAPLPSGHRRRPQRRGHIGHRLGQDRELPAPGADPAGRGEPRLGAAEAGGPGLEAVQPRPSGSRHDATRRGRPPPGRSCSTRRTPWSRTR